mmetsp:Transcript_92745/g.248032  ORF Transcript_92745/g.248032 Transcript_92745/m.248032 type:complete len:191 (+) Transcript_92745:41-613(+)
MTSPCCPPGSYGPLVDSPGADPTGEDITLGSTTAYVKEPTGAPTGCIVVVHDLFGYKSGRHRQIADFLASKGWLVVMPDFYKGDNAPEMGNWWEKFIGFFKFIPFAYRTMRTSSAKANLEQLIQDDVFPWLEEKKSDEGAVARILLGCFWRSVLVEVRSIAGHGRQEACYHWGRCLPQLATRSVQVCPGG